MKKILAAVLLLSLLTGMLLTPCGALALTDIEYKRSLAAENVELGADAIGMFLRAEYVGYVFTQPRKDAKNIGKTEPGYYYEILDYQQNVGVDAYFLIEFGQAVGWVLVNKVKVTNVRLEWSEWSEWTKQKVKPSPTCQVESKKQKETRDSYKYSRYVVKWTAPDSETVNTTIVPYEWTNIPEGSTILSSKWEYKTTYTQQNVVRLFAGMAEYSGGWYNEEGPIPKTVTYTYYRYRTATFVK